MRVQIRSSGRPQGLSAAQQQIRQEVAAEVGRATIRRAARRLSRHPSGRQAAAGMRVEAGAGQATIYSPMGNPGVIPAFRDSAGRSRWGKLVMVWPGQRHPVKWVRRYKGLRPLLEAEMSRVTTRDVSSINYTVR